MTCSMSCGTLDTNSTDAASSTHRTPKASEVVDPGQDSCRLMGAVTVGEGCDIQVVASLVAPHDQEPLDPGACRPVIAGGGGMARRGFGLPGGMCTTGGSCASSR